VGSILHPLFEGIILGLTVAITLGPALFALLQTSIKHGIKTGVFLALGIFFSDLTLVVGCFFGANQIITKPGYHLVLGIIGGLVMGAFGFYTVFKKISQNEQIEPINEIIVKKKGALPYFFKGYFLNLANPTLWVFWITSVIAINSTYGGDQKNVALFFSGTLGIILTTDILKVVLANKIKVAGNPQVRIWMNRIVGLLFIIIGVFVIIGSLIEYYRGLSL